MTPAEQQAQAIYEQICQTSADRPFSGKSVEEMMRAIASWQADNPALAALRQAPPEVHLAFVAHSLEWLRAEARPELRNFRVCQSLSDAIQLAIQRAPKPFAADLMLALLSQYRQDFSMARMYFPFLPLLSTLTRDQVTEEIRAELRKLHLQFAPSPTGKMNERDQDMRERIAELMRVEGEKPLDPGRGPWSQIVFDEITAKMPIARSGWEELLEHCRSLEAAAPGAKWNKRSRELIAALGEAEVYPVLIRWLALGPTPGQPAEARSPIEDSAFQKGAVWCVALNPSAESAAAVADFGAACLRKVPMLGAVSQKVGFACVQALGAMDSPQAISQLARVRVKVKYAVARRLIEKSLLKAAERAGISVEELEDMSVERFGLDDKGVAVIEIAGAQASVHLSPDGHAAVAWKNEAGKLVKSAPALLRKSFPREVRSVSTLAKNLEEAFRAQRDRLESSFLRSRSIPLPHWRRHFLEHPLLGFLGRRLIWVFSGEGGWERSGLWSDGEMRDSAGGAFDLAPARSARFWHPLSSQPEELRQWRRRLFETSLRQPFRQAFREFYQPAEETSQAAMHSNRFAGIIVRQHQLAALCRARGWTYRLQGAGFDGVNVPTMELPAWNMHAEFYVDLPSDRDRALLDSGLGEQSGAGINLFIASDQVRFYRDRREIPLEQVPAIVYSEVMRDVDLFTSVCAVGDDETWSDQGERGSGVLLRGLDFQEISAVIALRAEMLADVLPLTSIFDRAKIVKNCLEVRGQLGAYRIQLAWDGAALVTDSGFRWLAIPRKLLDAVPLDLSAFPIELDYRSETVLRKAFVLANDWKIEEPGLVRQFMPQ